MRKYVIEIMEFNGVYYPENHKVEVEASNLEEALQKVIDYFDGSVEDYEIEDAIERLKDDGYDIMVGRRSNEFIALTYNDILDVGRESDYRLLRGYSGKKKSFDLVADMEEKI